MITAAEANRIEFPDEASVFRQAILRCPELVVVATGRDGLIRTFNAGAERMLGYRADEVIDRLCAGELFDPSQLAELAGSLSEEFETAVSAGFEALTFKAARRREDRYELDFVCRSGRRFAAMLFVHPLRGDSGQLTGFLLIGTDISERARLEERLLWTEEAFRAIAETVADHAVLMLDPSGCVLSWPSTASRLLGYAADEVTGRHFSCLYSPEDVAHGKPKSGLDKAEAKGSSKDEGWLIRKDGTAFLAEITLAAIRNRSGRLSGFVGIASDLTERRRIDASLRLLDAEAENYSSMLTQALQEHTTRFRESDELLRQMTINIPHAIWIREAESRKLLYINPTWTKMTGLPVSVGDTVDHLYKAFHPDDLPLVVRDSRKFPHGGIDFDRRILRPDGTILWVRVRTFPITNAEGKIVRVAGIMEDITARREEEKRLERLKDDFVSMVSHELRTPMTSIAGSLGLLARNAEELSESAERLVRIALSNSERLVRLINGILDIEKIESGEISFDMRRVRIRHVVEQTIESVRGFASAHAVQVRLDRDSADCDVRADPDRLAQVITNLLSNAIKFSPSGRQVVVSIQKGTDTVRVSVRDQGPGIPDSFKPRLFEKFAQAENLEGHQKGGTGLGLSIAREIVVRLGGEIGFEDAPGGGTIFYFELPDWAAVAKAEQALERGPPASSSKDAA